MLRHLVICIAVLTSFVWCSDSPYDEYQKCKNGISDESCYTENSAFKSWEKKDINIFSNTENVCQVKNEYIKLIDCKKKFKQCGDKVKDLLMTAEAEKQGFLHICTNPEAINMTCLKRAEPDFSECEGKANFSPLSSDVTYEELKEHVCRIVNVTLDCRRESTLFKDCPETRSALLKYREITHPKACGGQPGSNNGQPSIFTHCVMFSQLILIVLITLF